MSFGIILELVTAALLVATIVACFALHRRVAALRGAQDEMKRSIEDFNAAAIRAENGVQRLREASEAAGLNLQKEIERARATTEDLAIAVRAGDRIVARLSQAMEARHG